jgi:hypothetical protein
VANANANRPATGSKGNRGRLEVPVLGHEGWVRNGNGNDGRDDVVEEKRIGLAVEEAAQQARW